MKKVVGFAMIIALFTSSCLENVNCIEGDGKVVTEHRQVAEFNELVNTTSIDVVYKKADSVSVTITAESNLMQHIVTSSSGGRLEIRTDPRNSCFDYTSRPLITVTSPQLSSMNLTGSGTLQCDTLSGDLVEVRSTGSGNSDAVYVNANDFNIGVTGSGDVSVSTATCIEADFTLTGSGNLDVAGKSAKATMRVTGSGDVKSYDFEIVSATETITGSGNIYTTVTNTLNAVISGSGNIYVKGKPSINQTITGSGRVIQN
ncbi:MAG TPA: head GIN domain-containing protein [Bacteroidales bacterium]|nr:head GIN domain-containing protein [Bacteroidales bacterium]